jgi:hypothetical protein
MEYLTREGIKMVKTNEKVTDINGSAAFHLTGRFIK